MWEDVVVDKCTDVVCEDELACKGQKVCDAKRGTCVEPSKHLWDPVGTVCKIGTDVGKCTAEGLCSLEDVVVDKCADVVCEETLACKGQKVCDAKTGSCVEASRDTWDPVGAVCQIGTSENGKCTAEGLCGSLIFHIFSFINSK